MINAKFFGADGNFTACTVHMYFLRQGKSLLALVFSHQDSRLRTPRTRSREQPLVSGTAALAEKLSLAVHGRCQQRRLPPFAGAFRSVYNPPRIQIYIRAILGFSLQYCSSAARTHRGIAFCIFYNPTTYMINASVDCELHAVMFPFHAPVTFNAITVKSNTQSIELNFAISIVAMSVDTAFESAVNFCAT